MGHRSAANRVTRRVDEADRKRQVQLARELTLRKAREGLFDLQSAMALKDPGAGCDRLAMMISIEGMAGLESGTIHESIEIDITTARQSLAALRAIIDTALDDLK